MHAPITALSWFTTLVYMWIQKQIAGFHLEQQDEHSVTFLIVGVMVTVLLFGVSTRLCASILDDVMHTMGKDDGKKTSMKVLSMIPEVSFAVLCAALSIMFGVSVFGVAQTII